MAAAADEQAEITSLLGVAEAWRRAGRLSDARALFMEAAQAVEAASEGPSLVAAVLGGGGSWVHESVTRLP